MLWECKVGGGCHTHVYIFCVFRTNGTYLVGQVTLYPLDLRPFPFYT
nr:MAG TPA: hypothetical protein [Caudoviricetes sp.]